MTNISESMSYNEYLNIFEEQFFKNGLNLMYPRISKKEALLKVEPIRNKDTSPKYRRNEPCPCNSKKKYKHCCLLHI